MNAQKLFRHMARLAHAHPHLAVALVCEPDGLKLGILNIIPQPEDWYQTPVAVEDVKIPPLKDNAWTAKIYSSRGKRELAP